LAFINVRDTGPAQVGTLITVVDGETVEIQLMSIADGITGDNHLLVYSDRSIKTSHKDVEASNLTVAASVIDETGTVVLLTNSSRLYARFRVREGGPVYWGKDVVDTLVGPYFLTDEFRVENWRGNIALKTQAGITGDIAILEFIE
jgi:hypothetical protein